MNEREKIRWINSWLQHFDRDSRRFKNCIRFGTGETREHILGKVNAILEVTDEYPDSEFLTECFSSNKKFRCDVVIFNPEWGIPRIIEIAASEPEESLVIKKIHWENEGFDFQIVRV